jgi:hypothetical protein
MTDKAGGGNSARTLEKPTQIDLWNPLKLFLRDRILFIVGVSKHRSQIRDRGNPGPLLIEIQVQLKPINN